MLYATDTTSIDLPSEPLPVATLLKEKEGRCVQNVAKHIETSRNKLKTAK